MAARPLLPFRGLQFLPALAFAASLFAAPTVFSATFTVNTSDDFADADPFDGLCAGVGKSGCSLRAAVQTANARPGTDTIVLPSGTYALTLAGHGEDAAASGDLDVRDALIIQGQAGGRPVIDAGYHDRVFDIGPQETPSKLLLNQVVVRRGIASFDDPAQGGGILVREGAVLRASDCALLENGAQFGGALAVRAGGEAELTRCHLAGNWIYGNEGFDLTAGGTAVHANEARVGIRDSSFAGNGSLYSGSVIYLLRSDLLLARSTLSDNAGTGVYGELSHAHLREVTIANQSGYGVRVFARDPEVSVTARNTIIAASGMADCDFSAWASGDFWGPNADSDRTCGLDATSGGRAGVDPLLGPLAYGAAGTAYRPLTAGSAAIDAGSALPLGSGDAACAGFDQLGQPRNRDGDGDSQSRCDLGAVER